ncbi:MAG: hypothetical protein WC365_05140 [Candidatus Babeliales bacterium]|jgi:hypothetical protein
MNCSTTHRRIVSVFFLVFFATPLCALNQAPVEELAIDDIDMDKLNAYDNTHPFRNPISVNTMATGLTLIKEPLWKSTTHPAGRDILYLIPYKISAIEYGGFALNFLFNMTNNLKLTTNDLFSIESFLAPENDIFNIIASFISSTTTADEIKEFVPFFKKITLQEYRSGMLAQFGLNRGPFSFQIHSSLQLAIRNLWLSVTDRQVLTDLLRQKFGVGDFNQSEGYRLRFGLGDTRVKIGLNTLNAPSAQIDVGLETILPTSRFSYSPNIQIGLAKAAFTNEEDLKLMLSNSVKGVRDYLLDPHLGNGHFGFGCYVEAKLGIFHDLIQWWNHLSYDVLFPDDENRIFMFRKTLTPTDIDPRFVPPNENTLNQYIRQYVFPSSFQSKVYPGGILNFVTAANADFTKRVRFALGYDFYSQQAERIKSIQSSEVKIQELRIEDTEVPSVYQHKIFSEILYHNPKPKSDFGVGVGGDITVGSRNIGEDWTFYIKVASSF